jgi:hypothetical protein
MQLDEVPMPVAVAALPRDQRGYPVLAITPWRDGEPRFGLTSTERVLVCAVERRCAICGTRLRPGDAWRVVSAAEAVAMIDAQARGVAFVNAAPTVEPPGHRACMLYSAIICPYLARPNARRGQEVVIADFTAARGDQRGEVDGIGGAVAGFGSYEFALTEFVSFTFRNFISCTPHRLGDDQLGFLIEALARDSGRSDGGERCPAYLLDDEDLAVERARRYL